MDSSRKITPKQAFLIVGGGFVVLLVVISVFFLYFSGSHEYKDEHIGIENINDYTRGNPTNKESLEFIEHALYATVNLNVDTPVEPKSIKDALVRDGTFSQEYNEDTDIHTVEFIVDIESLRQSYRASYQWPGKTEYSEFIDEWGTAVRCVPVDELIYGDFNCRDMFTVMAGQIDEALEAILPHKTTFYSIQYYVESGEPIISIVIQSNTNSEETMARFLRYRDEALSWMRSQGINPDEYEIQYRNVFNLGVQVEPQGE